MKILQIITQQEAGGAQSRAVKMMAELQQRGHTVTTLFLFLKRPAFPSNPHIVNLWPCRPKAYQLPLLFLKLWQYIRREQADIVMSYTHWGNVIVAPVAWLAGVRHVLANQTQVPQHEPTMARLIDNLWGYLGLYQFNICNSRTTELEMHKRVSARYAARLRRVTLGVLIPKTALSKKQLRTKYKLPVKTPLLISVGRLSAQKNHEAVLQALVHVPHANLACVGDGERRDELYAMAKKLGIQPRVFWLGERAASEVAEILQSGDIFVFPSHWEGFGLAPIEASSAGLPLVVSNIKTFQEVMKIEAGPYKDKMAACMVDPKDPQQLAEVLNTLLSNQEELEKMKQLSQELANQYGLARMTDNYEHLFQEALYG